MWQRPFVYKPLERKAHRIERSRWVKVKGDREETLRCGSQCASGCWDEFELAGVLSVSAVFCATRWSVNRAFALPQVREKISWWIFRECASVALSNAKTSRFGKRWHWPHNEGKTRQQGIKEAKKKNSKSESHNWKVKRSTLAFPKVGRVWRLSRVLLTHSLRIRQGIFL